jgi:hypothetical protein
LLLYNLLWKYVKNIYLSRHRFFCLYHLSLIWFPLIQTTFTIQRDIEANKSFHFSDDIKAYLSKDVYSTPILYKSRFTKWAFRQVTVCLFGEVHIKSFKNPKFFGYKDPGKNPQTNKHKQKQKKKKNQNKKEKHPEKKPCLMDPNLWKHEGGSPSF